MNSQCETIRILNNDKWQPNYGSASTFTSGWEKIRIQQMTYPKAVLFVLFSKFFEAFAANGVRTVMALYLRDELNFSVESSMTFYHIFNFFSMFCPIFGAILADTYFGNIKTIFYLYFVYACGWIGMVILSLPFSQSLPVTPFIISSFILIGIGNGSIRACIASLGGSQFRVPEERKELYQYFSHYYFIYTFGIVLSKFIPPEIRAQTKCFGKNECYAAVWGSLGTIFLISWIIFLFGMLLYKREQIDNSEGNILFRFCGCIYNGVKHKFKCCTISWREGAELFYADSFVEDVSACLKVLKLFIPLPMYWALYAQMDSSWTFQSSQLNTTVFGFKLQADQIKGGAALVSLILIPTWQNIVVPMLMLCNIRISPLKSIVMGGFCASLAFVCAGILQLQIESQLLQATSEKISVYWQFPQFIFVVFGELWLSIPGMLFAFTQAPPSLKSVMTAAWFCNNAFGNLIVVGMTEMEPFKLQSSSFFFYSLLMLICVVIFSWLASDYKYTNYDSDTSDSNDSNDSNIKSQSEINGHSLSQFNRYAFVASQEGLDKM